MLRTALKPRWLALLAVVLLLATVMARLGQWQWDRAREQGRKDTLQVATSRPAVPLLGLLQPQQSFTNAVADRPVTVTGDWDGSRQLLVADRYLNGEPGWWVLTPLTITDATGRTGTLAVVRGWVPSASDAAASPSGLPTGPVQLQGVLRPGEPPIDRDPGAGSGLPDGQIDGVDLTQLVQRWPNPLITGYLVLTGQQPAPTSAGAVALRAVPPTSPGSRSLAWQNLSYAVQWFVFAGFGLFMWWRLVRDDHRGRLHRPGNQVPGASPPDARDTPDDEVPGATSDPDQDSDQDSDQDPDQDSAAVPDRGA